VSLDRKVCPVVLRRRNGRAEILAFRHPTAGLQLVKGSIEPGEDPARAALRELFEESGIEGAEVVLSLGAVRVTGPDQEWQVFVCSTGPLPDAWSHFTEDGGGHAFSFFWHPLDEEPDDDWHSIFKQAVNFIRSTIENSQ
jgi:8-oxo-dGTP pyrophosphatase MutT (NUDIX family)